MQSPKYRIYPSLLDKFQDLLDYELIAEEDWNLVSEAAHKRGEYLDKDVGDYKLTPDEMFDKIEQELIDAINRVERPPSEAADRGTVLNEIIDCLIEHRTSNNDKIQIKSLRDEENRCYAIEAQIDDFQFVFDYALCKELRQQFDGAVPQCFTSAILPTRFGDVELYGFIDYWLRDTIIDLKTTSAYTFGKYGRKWQRWVYPYTAVESGAVSDIKMFTYLPVVLTKSIPIKGTIYREDYNYNHDEATFELRYMVEGFIRWLESQREKITDKKIFNAEEKK
jgi:hypothetical protein